MSRRSASTLGNERDRRAANLSNKELSEIYEHLEELIALARLDQDRIDSLLALFDFDGINVEVGEVPGWDPVTKTLTVPLVAGKNLTVDDITYSDGKFTWLFSDGTSYTTPSLIGPQGDKGDKGDRGEIGPRGDVGPQGPRGAKGEDAQQLYVTDIHSLPNGQFKWVFSDGSELVTEDLRGPAGANGAEGRGVSHSKATSTTAPSGDYGVAGYTDTYTLYADALETDPIGTFKVKNGDELSSGYIPYYNNVETPYTVGNVVAGTTFDGWTFQDLMNRLFYPDGEALALRPFPFVFEITDQGSVSITDPAEGLLGKAEKKVGTTIVIEAINGQSVDSGTFSGTTGGKFTITSSGLINFDPEADFETLPKDTEQLTELVYTLYNQDTYERVEGKIKVTVAGTNKAPTADNITAVTKDSTDDVNINLSTYFRKKNIGPNEGLTFSTSSDLPEDLELSSAGVLTGTLANNAHTTTNTGTAGLWAILVRATDNYGAYIEKSLVLTIKRPTLSANNKVFTISASTADKTVTANESLGLLSGITGKDLGDLSIVSINGNSFTAPYVQDSDLDGKITVNADGSYVFETNNEFDHITAGSPDAVITIPVVVKNGRDAQAGFNIKITVKGDLSYPVLVDPELTDFSVTSSGDLSIVGNEVVLNAAVSFNRGSITLGNDPIEPRTGIVTAFNFTGEPFEGAYTVASSSDLIVNINRNNQAFTATEAATTITVTASYEEGIQPKDSKGNDYNSPYPAGTSNSKTYTIPAASKYYWYATTINNNEAIVEQSAIALSDMGSDADGSFITLVMGRTEEGEHRSIIVPKAFGTLKAIKIKDLVGNWVWYRNAPVATHDDYEEISLSKGSSIVLEDGTTKQLPADYWHYTNRSTLFELAQVEWRLYFTE